MKIPRCFPVLAVIILARLPAFAAGGPVGGPVNTDGINADLPWKSLSQYPAPHAPEVFIELQDHKNPVRFRNIWIRSLHLGENL
jgi:hypothetical protein